jgi:pimeloyl-ACP methyl ester carboxylesterase
MRSLEDELFDGIGHAWISGCQSAARAASGLLTALLGGTLERVWPPVLHWERTGSGSPVLLIMGLGLSGGAWWRTVPVLARCLEVVTFDNRGVGRSRALFHAYTTEAMADDAASVLDAAGVDRVHVYGISLGGMVAQQLALRHPGRVRSLVLGATNPGGPDARLPEPDVLAFLRRRLWMRHDDAVRTSVEFNYSERCLAEHPERIAEDIAQRLAHPFSAQAYRAQMWAAALHDCYHRLDRIEAPTLVVHGSQDRMIPVDNGRMIAARIPGARLIELEDTGHLYPTEAPHVDEEISSFMRSHS